MPIFIFVSLIFIAILILGTMTIVCILDMHEVHLYKPPEPPEPPEPRHRKEEDHKQKQTRRIPIMFTLAESTYKPLTVKYTKHLLSTIEAQEGSLRQEKLLTALQAVAELEAELMKDTTKVNLNIKRTVYLPEIIKGNMPMRWTGSVLEALKEE